MVKKNLEQPITKFTLAILVGIVHTYYHCTPDFFCGNTVVCVLRICTFVHVTFLSYVIAVSSSASVHLMAMIQKGSKIKQTTFDS